MNEITTVNETMIDREEAIQLDQQIKVYANMAWQNLVESCKCLKRMKDTEGYKSLGYETFGEYTKASLNIEERQAYTYISTIEKQGEAFLQSNASLGITKLSLLNAIPDIEREEFVESHDLAGMSVKEVRQLVEENNHKAEQIDMLTAELDEAKRNCENAKTKLNTVREDTADELAEAAQRISELEDELEREHSKPTEVAVAEPDEETLNRIRAEAADAARKEAEKAAKAEKKELKEKLKAEQDKAVAAATEQAKKDIEDYKAKCDAADSARAEAISRAEELEKQLAVASSPETTRFTFFFEALDTDYQKIFESLTEIKKTEPEVADKYGAAMQEYYKIIAERFKDLGYPMIQTDGDGNADSNM